MKKFKVFLLCFLSFSVFFSVFSPNLVFADTAEYQAHTYSVTWSLSSGMSHWGGMCAENLSGYIQYIHSGVTDTFTDIVAYAESTTSYLTVPSGGYAMKSSSMGDFINGGHYVFHLQYHAYGCSDSADYGNFSGTIDIPSINTDAQVHPAIDLTPSLSVAFNTYNCTSNQATFVITANNCTVSYFSQVATSLNGDLNKVLYYSYNTGVLSVSFSNDMTSGSQVLLYTVVTNKGTFQGSVNFTKDCGVVNDVEYRVDFISLGDYDLNGNAIGMLKVLKSLDGGGSWSLVSASFYTPSFSQTPNGGTDDFSFVTKSDYLSLSTTAVDSPDLFHYSIAIDSATLTGDFSFGLSNIMLFNENGDEITGTPTGIIEYLRQILDSIKAFFTMIVTIVSLIGTFLGVVVNLVIFLGGVVVSLFQVASNLIFAFANVVFNYTYSYLPISSLVSEYLPGAVEVPSLFTLPLVDISSLDTVLEYLVVHFVHSYLGLWSVVAVIMFVKKHFTSSSEVDVSHKESTFGGD